MYNGDCYKTKATTNLINHIAEEDIYVWPLYGRFPSFASSSTRKVTNEIQASEDNNSNEKNELFRDHDLRVRRERDQVVNGETARHREHLEWCKAQHAALLALRNGPLPSNQTPTR